MEPLCENVGSPSVWRLARVWPGASGQDLALQRVGPGFRLIVTIGFIVLGPHRMAIVREFRSPAVGLLLSFEPRVRFLKELAIFVLIVHSVNPHAQWTDKSAEVSWVDRKSFKIAGGNRDVFPIVVIGPTTNFPLA